MATINGTPNDDVLDGTTGNDVILGLAGDDELSDDAGKDKLDGGAGNDTLDGGADNDTLIGGDHDDSLFGGTGNDAMTGGKGNDVFYVDSAADKLTEAADQGHDTVVSVSPPSRSAPTSKISCFAAGAINGIGNTLNNVITGNDFGNTARGGGGNDQPLGYDGNGHPRGRRRPRHAGRRPGRRQRCAAARAMTSISSTIARPDDRAGRRRLRPREVDRRRGSSAPTWRT